MIGIKLHSVYCSLLLSVFIGSKISGFVHMHQEDSWCRDRSAAHAAKKGFHGKETHVADCLICVTIGSGKLLFNDPLALVSDLKFQGEIHRLSVFLYSHRKVLNDKSPLTSRGPPFLSRQTNNF